jgi:hypothetical protein
MNANIDNPPPEPPERMDKDHGDEVPSAGARVEPGDRKSEQKKSVDSGLV